MRRYKVAVGGRTYVIDVQEVTANDFRVAVEGRELDVTLSGAEDLTDTVIAPGIEPSPAAMPEAPSAAPFKPVAPDALPPMVPAKMPPLPPPAAGPGAAVRTVKAPMPGTITAVEVAPGQRVNAGQVLLRLEAMKMVNAIKAPRAARVAAVHAQQGQSVGYGHVLVTFEED